VVALKRLFGIALVWGLAMGCYTLQPVVGNPLPLGTQVGLDITDAGRVALGGSMGPEIAQIEGRLIGRDSNEYVLSVSMVHLLRGGEQIWTGERIRVRTEHVAMVRERKLSKGRTAAMAAVSIGVIAAIVRQSVTGSLFGDDGKLPLDTFQATRIPRR
jgi:hypothetical protein